MYLVCCLYLCSPAAQFHIHQSVLSPCFGSASLSVKDITQWQIHHDRAIQQSVMPLQLLFFNKTSHPANVPFNCLSLSAAGQTCWCLGLVLKHTWCRVRSCFSGGHACSLTPPEVITVPSCKLKKLGLRWYLMGLWLISPVRPIPSERGYVMSITLHVALIKGGDVGCQLSKLEQIPENSHHLPRPYAYQALCDAMTPVFKNTLWLVCGRWKHSASHCHAKTSLWNTIHLRHEMEHVVSNCSHDVFGWVANINTWIFSFNLKKATDSKITS